MTRLVLLLSLGRGAGAGVGQAQRKYKQRNDAARPLAQPWVGGQRRAWGRHLGYEQRMARLNLLPSLGRRAEEGVGQDLRKYKKRNDAARPLAQLG
jgi:hypothetical protein